MVAQAKQQRQQEQRHHGRICLVWFPLIVLFCLWFILRENIYLSTSINVAYRRDDSVAAALTTKTIITPPIPDQHSKPPMFVYGFFLQVYKNPTATRHVMQSILKYMPTSPIYIVSSNGFHYDALVDRLRRRQQQQLTQEQQGANGTTTTTNHRIHYSYSSFNIDLPRNQALNISLWFDRVSAAAAWCNCSYLILMEDDTYLRKPLIGPPPHDAGGVRSHEWTQKWTPALMQQFVNDSSSSSPWSYSSHGMCGGSYIRVEAFLHARAIMNWTRLEEMSKVQRGVGVRNDKTLAVIMMDAGYTLLPWDQVTEYGRESYDRHAALVHGYKGFYRFGFDQEQQERRQRRQEEKQKGQQQQDDDDGPLWPVWQNESEWHQHQLDFRKGKRRRRPRGPPPAIPT